MIYRSASTYSWIHGGTKQPLPPEYFGILFLSYLFITVAYIAYLRYAGRQARALLITHRLCLRHKIERGDPGVLVTQCPKAALSLMRVSTQKGDARNCLCHLAQYVGNI
jgi:hypothetical protein